jgi:uncharacterized protein
MKVQHALRAFTAVDRKAIKMTAENYPLSEFYKTEELLTSLGIGEALVTVLSERGTPTPLAATLLKGPRSRMNILTPQEIDTLISSSAIAQKYNKVLDSESAYEILTNKLMAKDEEESEAKAKQVQEIKKGRKEKSTMQEVLDSSITKQVGRTVFRELTRGLLGVMGIGRSTRRRSGDFF